LEVWQDPDLECLMLDSTTIRAHQHAAGAIQKNGSTRASAGRVADSAPSLAVDAEGRPLDLTVTPGQEHDICQAPRLSADHEPPYVIADKGYDSDEFVRQVEERGSTAVIPSRSGRTTPRRLLKRQYRHRNHVERFVSRIKHFRRVATRYENTAHNFLGLIKLAALLSLRPNVNTT
jgi:transposase